MYFFQVLSLAREGELSLRAYKCKMQASCLQIAKYQKIVEEKDDLLIENEAKIITLEVHMLIV